MNSIEKQIVDILKDLRENYGFASVKTEFEAEGAMSVELLRLKDVTDKAGVDITLKIGGAEGATGIKNGRLIGVERVVAPMIESEFALQKFISCVDHCYAEDERDDLQIGVNIETITGYRGFDDMLASPHYPRLNSVVFARGDMRGSMKKDPAFMESEEMLEMAVTLFRKSKERFPQIKCVLGGVPSPNSFEFIRKIPKGLIDGYESRKSIFHMPEALDRHAVEGFEKALSFEILWGENKSRLYGGYGTEDAAIVQRLYKWREICRGMM